MKDKTTFVICTAKQFVSTFFAPRLLVGIVRVCAMAFEFRTMWITKVHWYSQEALIHSQINVPWLTFSRMYRTGSKRTQCERQVDKDLLDYAQQQREQPHQQQPSLVIQAKLLFNVIKVHWSDSIEIDMFINSCVYLTMAYALNRI